MTPDVVVFRAATAQDSDAIAALHASSWRAHYRGAASDAYLDGPVEAERQAFWAKRLATPRAERAVVLAETEGRLVGFACAVAGQDARWGSLIDNFHVAVECKGRGIGRGLMREVAARLRHLAPDQPVHLFVLAANRAARAFYDRMGGEAAGEQRRQLPDGSDNLGVLYAWMSPDHLRDRAGGGSR